jgi:trans-2,3-dihydro-3-hydroxyanthranilate isomerase
MGLMILIYLATGGPGLFNSPISFDSCESIEGSKGACQLSAEETGSPNPLELPYRLCDVFTTTPLQGNQLAVFEDAGALTTEEMQKLANETNLSETTFIVRKEREIERKEGIRVRIFTTREELPFAGHPTLGTAATIRAYFPDYAQAEEIVLDLNVGKVPVRFFAEHGSPSMPYGVMTQPKPVFGGVHDPVAVAAALGLRLDDLSPVAAPQTVSTGIAQCVVMLRSLDPLKRLQIPQREATAYLASAGARFFYCIAAAPRESDTWRARMQFYGGEDPATGSAAGCAIAYLVHHGLASAGRQIHFVQGVEIGRRSDLFVRASKTPAGEIVEVTVGGSTVPVAKGIVFLRRFT